MILQVLAIPMMNSLNIYTRNSAAPASDCDGRVIKTAPPEKTRHNHWAGDTGTSQVCVSVGSTYTCNQIFLSMFHLA